MPMRRPRRPESRLCDADIRTPLLAWLIKSHEGDPKTGIIEEFKMPRPSARIDVALVNGQLAGYEIKSDADTLVRLRSQIPAYSGLFDRVSVVTTKRHVEATRVAIPKWWGIIVASSDAPDQPFKVLRKGRLNPAPSSSSLLYALTKSELQELLEFHTGRKMRSARKDTLVCEITRNVPNGQLRDRARELLRERQGSSLTHHRPFC